MGILCEGLRLKVSQQALFMEVEFEVMERFWSWPAVERYVV